MNYPRLPFLFRPYLSRELLGWGRLYRLLGIPGIDNVSPRWRHAPLLKTTGKMHGYRMQLRLSDDTERAVYFLRRNHDLDVQMLLNALVAPGDTVVDVGANIGMTTLHAAHLTGPRGRVLAFEPQAACCRQIERLLADNRITHVQVFNMALAERESEATLSVLGGGTVMGTLAVDSAVDGRAVREQLRVNTAAGDTHVLNNVVGSLVVKIDVEGYELHVLRGLEETVRQHRPVVVTEVMPRFLARAGTSVEDLVGFFQEREYRGYRIGLRRRLLRHVLHLAPLPGLEELGHLASEIDVVWIAAERDDVLRRVLPVG